MAEWKILSIGLDHFIKGLWGRILLRSDEELFDIFLREYLEDIDKFIDFSNKKLYCITDKEVERMRIAFNKRIKKKRKHYINTLNLKMSNIQFE